MPGKPQNGRKKALTGTQRQRRWRAGKKGEEKRARRDQRIAAMAARTLTASAALTATAPLYGVLYADPPWDYEPWSRVTGTDRNAVNHYPTMSTAAICALPVPAAPHCVLFLWSTAAMQRDAHRVIEAWGFTQVSAYYWHKPGVGHGYWSTREQIETLLVATRGTVPAPLRGAQPPQLMSFPRGAHSEKPAYFAQMIEALYPGVPKLEMFARRPREGWDVWGNEHD